MKICPLLLLAITTVAATGSSSSEQTKLLITAFNKLQQTEFIDRAVLQAQPGSSQDQADACLNGTENVNADSSYSSAFSDLGSCPVSEHIDKSRKTATAKVDFSSCQPAFGNVQLACTTAGGQFQTIPEQKVSCRISGGVTVKVEMLHFPGCVGKDCPRDFLAIDEVKQIREKQLAEMSEAEFRNAGQSATCYSGSSRSASSKVSALAVGVLLLGGLAF